jgi:outer membrane protein OmpA-like peptidoglycan-associated protein
MRRTTKRDLSCVALGCAALLATACDERPTRTGDAATPPPVRLDADGFRDSLDLLEAIEDGSFARRAGLADEIRQARLPDPVVVEFVSGTRVPDAGDDALRGLASRLDADERLRVDLIGCSDPSGSATQNRRISQRRAESVAARLRELGVGERQLGEVVGRGESCDPQQRVVRIVPEFADSYTLSDANARDAELAAAPITSSAREQLVGLALHRIAIAIVARLDRRGGWIADGAFERLCTRPSQGVVVFGVLRAVAAAGAPEETPDGVFSAL